MHYRRLGKTDLKVSMLGFGASSLGSVFRDVEEAHAIETTRLAIELGLNFIDTSPFYGLTKSETILRKALKGIPRESYVLATKCGRYGYKVEDCDYSARRVTASIEESLERMRVDYLDLIQVHDMEFGDPEQIIGETIPALREAQAKGKARWVGITCLPLGLMRHVFQRVEVDTIQSYCHYCLNDTALEGLLPELARRDIGVINAAPLAMRLLTQAGAPEWHPAPREVRDACARAASLCQERGVDIADLALRYAIRNEAIHTNLVSTASPERLRANVRTVEQTEPIDEALLTEVLSVLAPVHNRTWPQGRPENNAV